MLPAIDAVRDIRVGPPILNPPTFRDGSQGPWRGNDVIIATDTSNASSAFHLFIVKVDQCIALFALQPRNIPFSTMYFAYATVPWTAMSQFIKPHYRDSYHLNSVQYT
ncbi:hypothetical protein A7D00_6368 [Trichophyton violaceum]|uniref:Uncharacterized protein n=1 Tax=Trichophyton violaceum TaxID=34388 RepID=A0A178FCA0_TRIVO|nr:hypothetical protein A7D00_6368 [Trichophyton violaceum]